MGPAGPHPGSVAEVAAVTLLSHWNKWCGKAGAEARTPAEDDSMIERLSK